MSHKIIKYTYEPRESSETWGAPDPGEGVANGIDNGTIIPVNNSRVILGLLYDLRNGCNRLEVVWIFHLRK